MNLFPYFIAFVKQRTVANRIRNPLRTVKNKRKPEIMMYTPNLEVGRWYAVETTVLVLPIVKHPTFPSVMMLERVQVLINGTDFCHSSVACWKTLCTSDIS